MNLTARQDIRTLSLAQLIVELTQLGEQPFRAKQVHKWLWQKGVVSFEEMTDLSKATREKLTDRFSIRAITINSNQQSEDKTVKVRFKLYDGHFIEGVLIPADGRMTACVSSQAGCSLTCRFCATGYMERKRNLNPDEIFDQVIHIRRLSETLYHHPLTNIVFMGMGEPMLNYKNVMEGIEKITSPDGLGISPQRITVSTAGIAKMIRKQADDGVKFKLALSLHAANDQKRNEIMPINEQNSLDALKDALKYYYQKLRRHVTYEYIVFDKFNDSLKDAEELVQFCKVIPCKVNLIEYNPISEANFRNAKEDRIEQFADYLRKHKIQVNIRSSRGKDIDAACGQLANK